jgi:hypothetical protein
VPIHGKGGHAIRAQYAACVDVPGHRESDEPKSARRQPRAVQATKFEGVPFLNVLAAAWIQFQVHDWFAHQKGSWESHAQHPHTCRRHMAMNVRCGCRSHLSNPPKVAGSTRAPAYINENSHWWDGSQVYGSNAAAQAAIRTNQRGKNKVGSDGRLLIDPVTGLEITGMIDNGWVGMSLMHGLFASEHNAVCDRFRQRKPRGGRTSTFSSRARLVVSALIAKIHTVEWSTSIPAEPPGVNRVCAPTGAGFWATRRIPARPFRTTICWPASLDRRPIITLRRTRLTRSSRPVYRMHTLIPDDYTLRSVANNAVLDSTSCRRCQGSVGRQVIKGFNLADLFYSLGIANPGAIRLHNYPRHLQNLVKDTASVSISPRSTSCAIRERGVPRYNAFRSHGAQGAVRDVRGDDGHSQWAQEIRHVLQQRIEKVDLMVGPDGGTTCRRHGLQRHGVPHLPVDGVTDD